jgi:hypothetical protein
MTIKYYFLCSKCGKKFVQISDFEKFYIVRWVPNNPIAEMFGVGFNSVGCGCGGFLIPLGDNGGRVLGCYLKDSKVLCA